ncbi:MAG: YcaO-like family protein [Gammaproteobacteria bacterium]
MFTLYYNYSNHFPICNTYHASMHYPTRIKLFANNLLSAPRTIGVDGVMSYGGGTGLGLDLPRKAFGEYFERNHFFTSVPVTSKRLLKDISSDSLKSQLLKCIDQVKYTDQDPLEHSFCFTTVNSLMNDESQEYLYNAISLNGEKLDGPFYNFNDSCACATHVTKQKSLNNSLMEFLERQALLGSWISKQYRFAIAPEVLQVITPYKPLVEKLLRNGELFVFENGVNLPGYSTIIFYFSKCRQDLVQYSVGSSAGLTLEDSLNGSFEELWQCYLFQYNAENSRGLEDRAGTGYHLSFQKCNHAGIRDIIPFVQDGASRQYTVSNYHQVTKLKTYTFDSVVSELADISSNIFYYHHFERALNLHFSKIVSPDFFVHMALEQPLNLVNAYSQAVGINRENAYTEKIPFP